jgi:hypothetical protein
MLNSLLLTHLLTVPPWWCIRVKTDKQRDQTKCFSASSLPYSDSSMYHGQTQTCLPLPPSPPESALLAIHRRSLATNANATQCNAMSHSLRIYMQQNATLRDEPHAHCCMQCGRKCIGYLHPPLTDTITSRCPRQTRPFSFSPVLVFPVVLRGEPSQGGVPPL